MGVRAARWHDLHFLGGVRHRGRVRVLEVRRPPKSSAGRTAGAQGAAGPEGSGDYDPRTGLWEFYAPEAPRSSEGYGWPEILKRWRLIVADLWDRGIDLSDLEVRRGRSWHWCQLQIEGLLQLPPQLVVVGDRAVTVPATRLALSLSPPDLPDRPPRQPEEA